MVKSFSQWRFQTIVLNLFLIFSSLCALSEAAVSYNYPFLKKIYYAVGHRSHYPRNFAALFYDVDDARNLPRPACCDRHVADVLKQKLDELERKQLERIGRVVWNRSLDELQGVEG